MPLLPSMFHKYTAFCLRQTKKKERKHLFFVHFVIPFVSVQMGELFLPEILLLFCFALNLPRAIPSGLPR
uniref:Uncharacterized protein n=1 Tax=Arundo donax TaxID=35708 RepID=A0A0A9B7K2_ARUDO